MNTAEKVSDQEFFDSLAANLRQQLVSDGVAHVIAGPEQAIAYSQRTLLVRTLEGGAANDAVKTMRDALKERKGTLRRIQYAVKFFELIEDQLDEDIESLAKKAWV